MFGTLPRCGGVDLTHARMNAARRTCGDLAMHAVLVLPTPTMTEGAKGCPQWARQFIWNGSLTGTHVGHRSCAQRTTASLCMSSTPTARRRVKFAPLPLSNPRISNRMETARRPFLTIKTTRPAVARGVQPQPRRRGLALASWLYPHAQVHGLQVNNVALCLIPT